MQNQRVGDSIVSERRVAAIVYEELGGMLPRQSAAKLLHESSRLSEDLGFDSLSRFELLRRIEARLGREVNDSEIIHARKIGTLIERIERALLDTENLSAPEVAQFPPRQIGISDTATTLLEAFLHHCDQSPEATHVRFVHEPTLDQNDRSTYTYQRLYDEARSVATVLQSWGVERQDSVGLMLPTGPDLLISYLAVLMCRAIPVPLYPPVSLERLPQHLATYGPVLAHAEVKALLAPEELVTLGPLVKQSVKGLRVVSGPVSPSGSRIDSWECGDANECALLQYTSGSTGDPKGVVLSHRNLLANVRAMTEVLRLSPHDVCVSWLPLYHDMGLIGAWLGSLVSGVPLVLMSPLQFVRHPHRWLEAIATYRGTISAGPNFAYQLCIDRITEDHVRELDLSSWRIALNGAEPVSARTISQFVEKFGPKGFAPGAMRPVYGLAESSLGVLFPREARSPRFLTVDTHSLSIGQRIQESREVDSSSTLVSCGEPLPGHDVRIVDAQRHEVTDRTVGILHFRGPSVTEGYRNNPAANRQLIQGDWRDSGDLAVRVEGEFFIVGRVKDLIIRAGKNIAPQDVEEEVSQVTGVRKGCVVAYSDRTPATEGNKSAERFVIVAETHLTEEPAKRALVEQIRVRVVARFDTSPDFIDLVSPRTIPKTSSGKLRRAECRERHRSGTLGESSADRFTALRIFGYAATLRLREVFRAIPSTTSRALWMLWCGGWFLALGLILMGVVLVSHSHGFSRRVARRLARQWLRLVRVSHSIEGLGHIPKVPCVVMSNHQSYLDAVVLTAILPERFSFVAKRDFANGWFFRWALPKLGVQWIERNNVTQSADDIGTLQEALLAGESLVIFPQGGFWRGKPDLPFKMGGFVLACKADAPVVPLALIGTEDVLPEGTWIIVPGAVRARIGVAQSPTGEEWSAALSLRQLTETAVRELREEGGKGRPVCG